MVKVYCFPVNYKQADSVIHKVAVDREKCVYHIYGLILDVTTTEMTMCLEK